MKKHFIILGLLLYVLLSSFMVSSMSLKLNKSIQTSNENTNVYARIQNDCYLLKTPTQITDYSNIYFVLQESYFVIVESEINEFYYVKYRDESGYVLKENLKIVNEIIDNPFLENITFDITKDTFLYSTPISKKENIITNINKTNNAKFIGKIYAEEISSTSSNEWYYSLINLDGKEIKGYIHSSFTNNLSPISTNKENYTFLSSTTSLLSLNQSTKIVIIIIISLPIIFLLYLFLKGFKKV